MDTILTVLGSGTMLPCADRHSAAHWIERGDTRMLLDCGSGTLHGLDRHGVDWRAVSHVLVTHYHNDHVGDLSALLFALKRERRPDTEGGLTLLGPPGFRGFLARLAAVLGSHVLDPGFPMAVAEITQERPFVQEHQGIRLRVDSAPTPHTPESMAYRVDLDGTVVGYTGDTGPSREVDELMAGCGVLVAECALPDPPELETHLTPGTLAEMARVADPALLVVTHVYPPLLPEEAARQVGARWAGAVVAAHDGLALAVPTPA